MELRFVGCMDRRIFFTTFTCNPKWPEIVATLAFEPGQKPTDRADIVVRVYNMKLEELLANIKSGNSFGPFSAGTCFFPSSSSFASRSIDTFACV